MCPIEMTFHVQWNKIKFDTLTVHFGDSWLTWYQWKGDFAEFVTSNMPEADDVCNSWFMKLYMDAGNVVRHTGQRYTQGGRGPGNHFHLEYELVPLMHGSLNRTLVNTKINLV